MSAVAEKLTAAERDLLAHAEEKIQRGLDTFFETGHALLTIRFNRLYREEYATFDAYCEERWGFSKRRANQLVDAVTVLQLISGTMVPEINESGMPDGEQPPNHPVETVIPATERQVRPLATLLPPQDATPEEKAAAEETIRDVWTSHGEIIDFLGAHPDIRVSVKEVQPVIRTIDAPPSTVGAAHWIISRVNDLTFATYYFFQIASRTNEPERSAVLAVDSRLRELRRNRISLPPRDYLYLLVKGWNHYARDARVSTLAARPKPGTEFRIPDPAKWGRL